MMSTSAPASYSFAPAFPGVDDHHHGRIHLPASTSTSTSSTRLSPASTASDSARSWLSAQPAAAQRTSSASPANENNGFEFVTASHPNGFKKKTVMQRVRKKAMNNFLEKRTEPARTEEKRKASLRSRKQSDDSTATEPSIVVEESGDVTSREDAFRLYKGRLNKHASPIASRTSSITGEDTTAVQLKNPFSRIETSFPLLDTPFIMNPAPLLEPMRPGKLMYDAYEPGPFKALGKPLDPFRAMYQASHASVSVEQLKFHCSQVFGTRAMGLHWVPAVIKSPHAFLSTLCVSSAHLDALGNRTVESVQTLTLRQEVMHRISQRLVNPATQIDDYNIIAVTQLICSEIIAGTPTMLDYHESGVEKMVTLRGGLDKLGVNGQLAANLTWVCIQSALVREAKPRKMYMDYANYRPSRSYPNTATIPESPFWCPRSDLETIKRSTRGLQRTVDLLKDARTMTRLFLGDDNKTSPDRQKQRETQVKTLYKKIAALPAVADMQATTVLTSREWTYEVCRLVALIQGKAMVLRVPFSRALEMVAEEYVSASSSSSTMMPSPSLVRPTSTVQPPTHFEASMPRIDSPVHSFASQPFSFFPPPRSNFISSSSSSSQNYKPTQPAPPNPTALLLSHVRSAVESSDISDTWSDFGGVLYWVTLVIAAASPSPSSSSSSSVTYTTLSAKDKTDLKVLKKWFVALGVRCAIRLCFEHEDAVLRTLGRAGRVVERCCVVDGDGVREASGSGGGRGKRRRVE